MNDQDGMRAIGAAVIRLAENLYPPEAFHRGDYHRLRVGLYRVVYIVDKPAV
jgi:mRNA-degrading endonuclease RelE of RelBE toxin-antitoxin system